MIDAELVSSYATLIKSTREIISDYITIYRDRQKHLNQIEMEGIKQENKKEIVLMKDNLSKSMNDNTDVHKAYIQEAVIDILDDRKRDEDSENEQD